MQVNLSTKFLIYFLLICLSIMLSHLIFVEITEIFLSVVLFFLIHHYCSFSDLFFSFVFVLFYYFWLLKYCKVVELECFACLDCHFQNLARFHYLNQTLVFVFLSILLGLLTLQRIFSQVLAFAINLKSERAWR